MNVRERVPEEIKMKEVLKFCSMCILILLDLFLLTLNPMRL